MQEYSPAHKGEETRQAIHAEQLHNKIDELNKAFQMNEKTKEQPLYANVQIQWKDNWGSTSNRIIKLVPGRDENIVFYNANGLEELKRLTLPENGKDFIILDVSELYGKQFNIAVVDYLCRDVNITGKNEKDAIKILDNQYSHAKIVLGMGDFVKQDVGQLESCQFSQGQVKLMATPENTYPFSVQEAIQHVEKIDARDLNEALYKVDAMLMNKQIIVGSEDDYMKTSYITHHRLIDNRLVEPVEIPLANILDFQKQLAKVYPNGMTLHLQNESVNHLAESNTQTDLIGRISEYDSTRMAGYGELRVEAHLTPDDYAYIYPDEQKYQHEGLAHVYDSTTVAATMYMYHHPDMSSGQVHLHLHPNAMKHVFVEDMPLLEAQQSIKNENIQTDKEFLRFCNIIKNRERISEVSLYKNSLGNTLIRCKIDGKQQSGKKLSSKDAASFLSGEMTKVDLAVKIFNEDLKFSQDRKYNGGMKR